MVYSIRGLTQSFLRDGVPDGLAINGYFRTLTDVESVEILNVPKDTRYYSPFSKSIQSIYRGAINHEWQVNPDFLVRNNLIVLYRDLAIA